MLKLNGIGSQLERGFGQVKRYAEEKLGTASEITELPREFLDLENKVNSVRDLLSILLKVVASSSSTVPTNAQEIARAINGVTGSELLSPGVVEKKTDMHIIGKAAEATGKVLAEEPFGAALGKFGLAYEQLGEAKLILDQEVDSKFLEPSTKLLNDLFANINRARKNVTNLRLTLDSLKSTQKASNPQRAESMQLEVEKAEDSFIEAVDECQRLMKHVVESNSVMSLIHQLVMLQLAYYKQSVQSLSNLVPELDEMLLTHDALYTPPESK